MLRCCLADVAIEREGDFQSDLYGEAVGGEGPCEHAAAEPVGHGARFSDGARAKRVKMVNFETRPPALRRPHPEGGGRMHLVSRSGLSSSNNFALHFPGKDEVTILSLSPPLRKEAITEPPPKRTKPPFLPLAPKRHTRQFLAFPSPDEGKWETDGANRTAERERKNRCLMCGGKEK